MCRSEVLDSFNVWQNPVFDRFMMYTCERPQQEAYYTQIAQDSFSILLQDDVCQSPEMYQRVPLVNL